MKRTPNFIISLLLCLCMVTSTAAPALAGVLMLPLETKIIGDEAFYGDKSIDEVVLPEGVEEIGERAFAETGLSKINLPESLKKIANNALEPGVKVTAKKGTKAYLWAVDQGFIDPNDEEEEESTLEWFEFSDNDDGTCTLSKYIGPSSNDLNIIIPTKNAEGKTVSAIGNRAFYSCTGLTGGLSIPDCITSIGTTAFWGCIRLTGSLTIPDSVTSIGRGAFGSCKGFTGSLKIPDSVTTIEYGVFKGCSGFTGSLVLPESITMIGDYAFSECSGFTGSLTLSENVTAIGKNAFYKCGGFSGSLTIPASVTSIGSSAFLYCEKLEQVDIRAELTTINLNGTFGRCKNLISIVLPSTVTDLGKAKTMLNQNLTLYGGNDYVKTWAAENHFSYNGEPVEDFIFIDNGDGTCTLSKYTGGETNEGLEIPSTWNDLNVTKIGDSAFKDQTGIKGNLILPDTIEVIERYAFYNCTGLTGDLVLPGSLKEIGYLAFAYSNLSTVTLPVNMEQIDPEAFYEANCELITTPGTYADDWTCVYGDKTTGPEISDVVFAIKRIHYIDGDERYQGLIKDTFEFSYGYKKLAPNDSHYKISYYVTESPEMPSMESDTHWVDGEHHLGMMYGSGSIEDPLKIFTFEEKNVISQDYTIAPSTYYLWIIALTDNGTTIAGPVKAIPEEVYISQYITLTGRCVTETGDPVRNVEVTSSDDDSIRTFTDDQGCWTIEKHPRNCWGHFLNFTDPTYYFSYDLNELFGYSSLTASYTENFDFGALVGTSKYISGKISTYDGEPLANVSVTATSDDDEPLYATSGEDGTWSIPVKQYASYTICYSLFGYNIYNDYAINAEAGSVLSATAFEAPICSVSGTVTIGTVPVESVYVYACNSSNEIVGMAVTDINGKWSMNLQGGETYTLEYSLAGYQYKSGTKMITPNENADFGSAELELIGESDGSVSFTMTSDNLKVGTNVHFNISCSVSDEVQLIVDGVPYEYIALENGSRTYDRKFYKEGIRIIQFSAIDNDGNSHLSNTIELALTADDDLKEPIIDAVGDQYVGQGFMLNWTGDDRAQGYTIYLYGPQGLVWPFSKYYSTEETTTPNTSFPILGDKLRTHGDYSIDVVAFSEGYNQATGSVRFTVYETDAEAAITYPYNGAEYVVGDTMHTNISGGKGVTGLRLGVSFNGGTDKMFDVSDNGQFVPPAEKVGTYKLTPYASVDGSTYSAVPSKAITVNVHAPQITGLKQGTNSFYSYKEKGSSFSFSGTIDDNTSVVVGGAESDTIPGKEGTTSFTWTSPVINDVGTYTFNFVPKRNDAVGETCSFTVAIFQSVTKETKYVSKISELFTIPTGKKMGNVVRGIAVEKIGICGDYSLIRLKNDKDDDVEGFILTDNLTDSELQTTSTLLSQSAPYAMVNQNYKLTFSVDDLVSSINVQLISEDTAATTYSFYGNTEQGKCDVIAKIPTTGIFQCNAYTIDINGKQSPEPLYSGELVVVDLKGHKTKDELWSRYREVYVEGPQNSNSFHYFQPKHERMEFLGSYILESYSYYYVQIINNSNQIVFTGKVDATEVTFEENKSVTRAIIIANLIDKDPKDDSANVNMNSMWRVFDKYCDYGEATTILFNRNGTDIAGTISNQLSNRHDYNDVTYIYWCGHGEQPNWYTFEPAYSWTVADGSFPYSTFLDILQNATVSFRDGNISSYGEIRLIIDTCYSGDFSTTLSNSTGRTTNHIYLLAAAQPGDTALVSRAVDYGSIFTLDLEKFVLSRTSDIRLNEINIKTTLISGVCVSQRNSYYFSTNNDLSHVFFNRRN